MFFFFNKERLKHGETNGNLQVEKSLLNRYINNDAPSITLH